MFLLKNFRVILDQHYYWVHEEDRDVKYFFSFFLFLFSFFHYPPRGLSTGRVARLCAQGGLDTDVVLYSTSNC